MKCFTSRQLNTKVSSGAIQKYLQKFDENLSPHRMIKKLGAIHLRYKSKKRFQREINKLDKQSKDMMTNAKKKCRRITSGRIPFLPESSLWIRHTQVYRLLIRYHLGLFRNVENLKRAARRCGISKCLSLSLEEIRLHLDVCIDKCDYFRKHGQYYRRKHFYKRLKEAKDKENERKEKEILAIIEHERNKSLWRRLNYSKGKCQGGAPQRILVEEGQEGKLIKYNTQESVQKAIFDNIHHKRFVLAEAAPIYNGELRRAIGYNATTDTATAILAGTYEYPPDFDQATREICEECARIQGMIPKDSVSIPMNKEEWQYQ
jgi:hypothetical protein